MAESGYAPIEAYGVVGNLETCALVAPDGSIDWFPFPHIESPSILAAILDDEDGGRFRIGPVGEYETGQQYVETTNVLETTFRTADGTATVTDFLPPAGEVDQPKKVIYRKVTCSEGSVEFDIEFEPQFDYGRAETTITATDDGILAEGGEERTLLESPVDLEISDGRVAGDVTLEAGDAEWFLLRCTGAEDANADPETALEETIRFWTDWAHTCGDENDCTFGGPWHDVVVRSGLVLKLLTHAETGSVLAAPTTSLPENVGGVRNWDYRYSWIRDSSATLDALLRLGCVAEAEAFFWWLLHASQLTHPRVDVLYRLNGTAKHSERELGLSGYRDSWPARVGNAAAPQRQLDVYGHLLQTAWLYAEAGGQLGADAAGRLAATADLVCALWGEEDSGIWEVRSRPRHFTESKMMCWIALDRARRLAERGHLPSKHAAEWEREAGAIRRFVDDRCWSPGLEAYERFPEAGETDASLLLPTLLGYGRGDDERLRRTVEQVRCELGEEPLVYRYRGEDGLPGREGAFLACSFWLVDALAGLGEVEQAAELMEELLALGNDVGLYAEEIDAHSGAFLGNFPQGLVHLALINAAATLAKRTSS